MGRRTLLIVVAVVIALLVFLQRGWLDGPDKVAADGAQRAPSTALGRPDVPKRTTGTVIALPDVAPKGVQSTPSPPIDPPVPMEVVAPQSVEVGAMGELTIKIASHRPIGRITFDVQFDPNFLQVRGATEGDWMSKPGVTTNFSSEIGPWDDRVAVRTEVSAETLVSGEGTVAVIQFQGMAPGVTAIYVNNVTVLDLADRPIPFTASSWSVPVKVGSRAPATR